MPILYLLCLLFSLTAFSEDPPKTPTATAKPSAAQNLRTEMSEAQYKFKKNHKNLSEYVAALESEVINICHTNFAKALERNTSSDNPHCLQIVDKLLSIHPKNPVAICGRESLASESCREAFREQKVLIYDGSQDDANQLIDPALKLGINAKERERLELLDKEIATIRGEVENGANSNDPRIVKRVRQIYQERLHILCRPSSERLVTEKKEGATFDDPEIADVRTKLLAIPANLRPDYQAQMTREYEAKLSEAQGNAREIERILSILKVISNPTEEEKNLIDSMERVRYVVPDCMRIIQETAMFDRRLPWPVCNNMGWFTPQCADAIRSFRKLEAREMKGLSDAESKKSDIIDSF